MTGQELARRLSAMVGMAGRQHLSPLARGEVDQVTLRYDHITDWKAFSLLLREHGDALLLWDGHERFIIAVGELNHDTTDHE